MRIILRYLTATIVLLSVFIPALASADTVSKLAEFQPIKLVNEQIEIGKPLLRFVDESVQAAIVSENREFPPPATIKDLNISICYGGWGYGTEQPLKRAYRDFVQEHIFHQKFFYHLKIPEEIWKEKFDHATAAAMIESHRLLKNVTNEKLTEEQGWDLENEVFKKAWPLYDLVSDAIEEYSKNELGETIDIRTVLRCIG